MDRLVIACMDRRLNEYLDTLNDGKTVFLRNAGGNAGSIANSIRYILNNNPIRKIHIVVHTDCGAMKVVAGSRDKSLNVSDAVKQGLVGYFEGVKFKDRTELEKENEKLQQGAVAKMVGGDVKVTSELFDISKVPQHGSGEHVLAITRAADAKYRDIAEKSHSEMPEMYTVQADSIEELMPDIEIAIGAIGIKKVRVVSLSAEEYRQGLVDSNKLKAKPFASGVAVEFVKA